MNSPDPVIPHTSTEPSQDAWRTKEVFDHVKHDLQSHFSELKDTASHATHEVQAAAASTAAAAREGYHALRQDAAAQYASHRRDLACQIRENPLKAVGIAALGGVVFGLLVRR